MDLTCIPFQRNGSDCLRLNAADGAVAEISLHGAHVLSWQPSPGRERLYLSPRASFADDAAIRGGIPVIFPQFGGRGTMLKHGFARLLEWHYVGVEPLAQCWNSSKTTTPAAFGPPASAHACMWH